MSGFYFSQTRRFICAAATDANSSTRVPSTLHDSSPVRLFSSSLFCFLLIEHTAVLFLPAAAVRCCRRAVEANNERKVADFYKLSSSTAGQLREQANMSSCRQLHSD
jgi:hypothetical protein